MEVVRGPMNVLRPSHEPRPRGSSAPWANQFAFTSSSGCHTLWAAGSGLPASGNHTPTTGSPVSRTPVHPYCGAVGVSHGLTALFTNGSSSHSATSFESAWMSARPRVGWSKREYVFGVVYAA